MIIYGIHAVTEALRAGSVTSVQVSDRADARLARLLLLAGQQGVRVQPVSKADLDRTTKGAVHQGVAAEARRVPPVGLEELVRDAVGTPLIVVLDGIEDPHNVGAILRTVDAAGGHGVVRQSRHAAPLEGAAAKASAGAAAHVRMAEVVNISRALDVLKAHGIWTVGLAADAGRRYDELDLSLATAVVLGSEGAGLRRLVREHCDLLAAIPMLGHVQSLNVSVAAGIVLFEAVRQRQNRARFKTSPDAEYPSR